MNGEENIEKYLEDLDVEWSDLSEEQKKTFGFAYKTAIQKLYTTIRYEINPKIKELEERTESKLEKVEDLNKFIEENEKAVVDVWDVGCLPCNLITPVLERLSRETNFAFGEKKLDEELMEEYGIKSIPTTLLFENGEVRKEITGAVPEKVIEAEVEALKVPKEKFEKKLEASKKIAEAKNWKLNPNPYLRNMLIVGLVKNEEKYGLPLCPCKSPLYNGEVIKENTCPCRQFEKAGFLGSEKEIEKSGHCFCGLFFDKDFEGKITEDYILKHFKESGLEE